MVVMSRIYWFFGALFIATLAFFYGVIPFFGSERDLTVAAWAWGSWNDENGYSHGKLIPFAILFLLWRKREELLSSVRRPSMLGLAMLGLGILFFLASVRTIQPRIAVGSLPFIILGAAWFLHGSEITKRMLIPVGLFFFAIPLPGLQQATNSLQLIATKIAHLVSGLIGVQTTITGNNITSVERDWGFDIAEGCSGIRSLMALTLIAAIYSYLMHKGVWRRGVLFAASVPIAIIANAARIVSIVLIAEFWSKEIAAGLYHDYSGFLFFPIALLGLIVCSSLLNEGLQLFRPKVSREVLQRNHRSD